MRSLEIEECVRKLCLRVVSDSDTCAHDVILAWMVSNGH